jgi:lactoylglutathione lyase
MSNDPPIQAGPRHLVTELRLVVTADEYEQTLAFYRDVLGLPELADFSSRNGRVRLLDAGRATVEIVDSAQAAYIDEVEVGRRVAGHIRVALEVDDTPAATRRLADAGGQVLAEPTVTPWRSLNARLQAPDGLQLTLFAELPDDGQEFDVRPGGGRSPGPARDAPAHVAVAGGEVGDGHLPPSSAASQNASEHVNPRR